MTTPREDARTLRYPFAAQWDDEMRRLEVNGRVVISQTPTDPGDIGEPQVIDTPAGTGHRQRPPFDSRRWTYGSVTRCGRIIWAPTSSPEHEKVSLVPIRRDNASRIARPCRICGAETEEP